MGGRRSGRMHMPSDIAGTLQALAECRAVMIGVSRCVTATGPVHHAAAMVMASIDAMATLLTRQRYYFSQDVFGIPETGDPLEEYRAGCVENER